MENETIIKTEQKLEVIDTITKGVLELDEGMLTGFLALIQFHQRVNKLFFDDEDFLEYLNEVDKACGAILKIKEENVTDEDRVKLKKTIGKAVEKYGSFKGKPIIMEIAIKLRKHLSIRDISNWIFSVNDLYSNTYDMYDWMY